MNNHYSQKLNKNNLYILAIVFLLPITLLLLRFNLYRLSQAKASVKCSEDTELKFTGNLAQTLVGDRRNNEPICFHFHAVAGQSLILKSNTKISLLSPSYSTLSLQGSSQNLLQNTGNYSIRIDPEPAATSYQLEMRIKDKSLANKPEVKQIKSQFQSLPNNTVPIKIPLQLSYNVGTSPPFKQNQKLQNIVDDVINVFESRGLPTKRLSVSLVDLTNSECCAYASYLDNEPRYPASIIKLFWMVELFSQYQAGIIPEPTVLEEDLYKMIQNSNNESASRILDKITQTKSGDKLSDYKLTNWLGRRYSVNQFFKQAGYQNINISQKPFPIPYLKLDKPEGRDLQIRQTQGKEAKPIRNYLTTNSVARLLFEIYTNKAISNKSSIKIKSLLKRDLQPEAWQQKPYNSIAGFLGEYLPVNTNFYSKMGWTFSNRNDAAIVVSPDKKAQYILVVFGDDPSFYKDKTIFPEISRMVYEKMTK